MKQKFYGLEGHYMFRPFQSRAEYKALTGTDALPFDPSRPVKDWLDPAAAAATKRTILYATVLAITEDGVAIPGSDGHPQLEPLTLSRAEAATVNLLPDNYSSSEPMGTSALAPVPIPLTPLAANEKLVFRMGGAVMIEDTSFDAALGLTAESDDHALIVAIAKKVGVLS